MNKKISIKDTKLKLNLKYIWENWFQNCFFKITGSKTEPIPKFLVNKNLFIENFILYYYFLLVYVPNPELGTIDLLNDSSSFGNSFSNLVHLMNSIFYVSQINSFGSFGSFGGFF